MLQQDRLQNTLQNAFKLAPKFISFADGQLVDEGQVAAAGGQRLTIQHRAWCFVVHILA